MSEMQPIDTAPTTGKSILVKTDRGRICQACYCTISKEFVEEKEWTKAEMRAPSAPLNPTHWMPMPE